MIDIRRLMAVGVTLTVAAVLTCSGVWGEPGRDKELKKWRKGGEKKKASKVDRRFDDELGASRFSDKPVVVYHAGKDETLVALQIKPKLAKAKARPRDILVMVDTSASKAEGYLTLAQQITKELSGKIRPTDRISIWTANLKPRDVSRGFKTTKGLTAALKSLAGEVPLGAVDLKKCLTAALDSFEVKASRQRVLLYLGDGKSVADPLDAEARAKLCAALVKKQVAFFAVPLGWQPDPQNLHGLISGTGGKCVRLGLREKPDVLVTQLLKDVAEPIFYPTLFKLPASITAALPSKLPPLRRDSATMVLGKMNPNAKTIRYRLSGKVASKTVKADASLKVPAADSENCFLVSVYRQWKGAKGQPALLPADRSLAYAYEQNQLAVESLLSKAEMALEKDMVEPARKLFEQARTLAPHSPRARGGLSLVEKMKTGKKTRADMLKELRLNAKREVVRLEKGKRKIIVLAAEDEKKDDPAPKERDPLDDVKARQAIAGQQATGEVNEAIRQSNRVVRDNPDLAYDNLKRLRDDIKGNTDLTPATVAGLVNRLNRAMESVQRLGAVVKRDLAEALKLRAAADARLDIRRNELLAQERIRERMRVFATLMDQAREQEAFRQAVSIRNDLVNQGQRVPPAVIAGAYQGLAGYHLRELRSLRRLREERFLAVLLEVERSHVPFPDEPPVEYPSDAVVRKLTRGQFGSWKDWSKYRIKEYAVTTFGSDVPGRLYELRDRLNKTINFEGLDDPKTTLSEALDQLSKVHDVTFDVNEKAFKYEMLNDVLKTPIVEKDPIPRLKSTLGTVLKKILSRVPVPSGATYLIRRDVIEITTGQFATAEKAVRVYPVADLVTPIPNAYNQQQVSQTATILGSLGQLGLAGGGLQLGGIQLGGGLQLGGLQLGGIQLGGLQLGGIQLGGIQLGGVQLGGVQLGGVQLGGVQLGGVQVGAMVGANVGGPAGLQVGGFNFQGNVNLGVGGGMAGFTGGQLGQLGNLGGQFGLQGGNQSQILITLIRQVVGRPKDWAVQYDPISGQPLNPLDDEKTDGVGLNQDNNNLGYYPPALALVVKAPTTVHTQASNIVITGAGGGAGAGAGMVRGGDDNRGGRVLVDGRRRPRVDVAGDGDDKDDGKGWREINTKKKDLDPRTIWQNALVKGVKEPGLIIATTDFLARYSKFDHVAEFLKANLRQGVVVKPWVYKSLSIALRESGGSAEEIERAEVSSADLQPLDSGGYLLAARALADDKNYDRALAFCRQAATLSPGLPHAYRDAARYADLAKNGAAMKWAVGNLLKQDWPLNNDDLQGQARQKLKSLVSRLKTAEGNKLLAAVEKLQRRDLVVKLLWQGQADLDLKVLEPTGSVCDALHRQTINGGTMLADSLASMTSETYVAASAFPGEYTITVERVWGKSLGNKAQLKIIRHQGTEDETEELITVRMNSNLSKPVTIKLDAGRRKETAYVPPAAAHLPSDTKSAREYSGSDQVMNKLRNLASPEVTGINRAPAATAGGLGRPVSRTLSGSATPHVGDRTLYQTKVASFVSNTAEVTAQAIVSADRRSVRLSLSPVFNTVTRPGPVQVISPVFPGGGR